MTLFEFVPPASIVVVLVLTYVAFVRPHIRAHRLSVALSHISDAFPAWRICFHQSALITSALVLDEADAVVTAGTEVVHGLAPAVPAPPLSSGTPEELRQAMQEALAADLNGLSISALDGVLDAVEKQTSGSVLEFWRQASEHWQQNPEHAVETAIHIAKTAVDASAVNIEGLFGHIADFGTTLHEHVASGPNLDPSDGLHHDIEIGFDDIDVNLDDPGSILHGIDPTMLFDGIPVITLVRSAFREVRLLSSDKTTALDSLKNLALDAGSTGGGIAGGLLLGSLILPGIGTFIGGAVGGLLGRMLGNHVKAIPCTEAVEAYQSACGTYQSEFSNSMKTWYEAFDKANDGSRKRYVSTFSSFALASQRPEANVITRRLMDAVVADYTNLANQILAVSRSSALIAQDRWYHLLGGLSIEAIVRIRADALASARLEQMEKNVREMRMVQGNAARLRFMASLACSEHDDIRAAFAVACANVDELVEKVFAEFQIWIGAARIAQLEAFKEASEVIAKERQRHDEVVSKWKSKLSALRADAIREYEKLGR